MNKRINDLNLQEADMGKILISPGEPTTGKLFLSLEFFVVFIALPLLYYFRIITLPKIPVLLGLTVLVLTALIKDREFHFKDVMHVRGWKEQGGMIVVKFTLFGLLLLGITYFFKPETLYFVPAKEPVKWAYLMIVYPVFSALPQELVYRSFFFHRYGLLFPRSVAIIMASAMSFAYLHIVYSNILAVALTLIGGVLFALTYQKTRSLVFVAVEHGLFGCLIFSVGLGRYFM